MDITGTTLTGCTLGPYYQSILPQYNGLQYIANASFFSSIDVFDGALFVGTQKDARTATPILISGLNRVSPVGYTRTQYLSGSSTYNATCNGVAVSSDRQRLLVSWPNNQFASSTGMRLGQFTAGSGTVASNTFDIGYPSSYDIGFSLAGKNSGIMYAGRSNGSGSGDFWWIVQSENYAVSQAYTSLALNTQGGMSAHNGLGQTIMLFDGYAWCGGYSNNTDIPLWKIDTAFSLGSVQWQGNNAAIIAIRSVTLLPSRADNVILLRTSDTSPTKRLYAFLYGANGFAYKTSHSSSWVGGSLPAGEYFTCNSTNSDNGKCYFVTAADTVSTGFKLRSIDESGNIELLSTFPSNSTMFPSGWNNVYCTEVVTETHPITNAIVAVGAWMYGSTEAFSGNFYLHVWQP